jgi:hypothetical protein
MPVFIASPAIVEAAGTPSKRIEEFVGRVNSKTGAVSIARMRSPAGWKEPDQTPEFDEYTVTTRDGDRRICEGQAIIVKKGEWVRYSTPDQEGAEYIAVCMPAFSPESVHRDRQG